MILSQVYHGNSIEQDLDRECQGSAPFLKGNEIDKYWPDMRMTLQTVSIGESWTKRTDEKS